MKVDVSIVVPAFNEAESLPELLSQIHDAMEPTGRTWEVIVVDDGSTDTTLDVLRELRAKHPQLHFLSFLRNYGKSPALDVGFRKAQGAYIVTMDADLQDDPHEVPALLDRIDQGNDLVTGWKKVRHDPITKTLPSKLFNRVTSTVSGIRLHDFNCGLKAYRGHVARGMPLYGEMHRFLPAIAHWQGYQVAEMPVLHHARKHGHSKFGANRFVNGFLDLLTVTFLHSGRTSPLHFFGRIGIALGLVGVIFGGFVVIAIMGEPVRTRPLFFIGLILILLAMQFISLGLLGELVMKGQSRPDYEFREEA